MGFNWSDFSSLDFDAYKQNLKKYLEEDCAYIIGTVTYGDISANIEVNATATGLAELSLDYFDNSRDDLYLGTENLGSLYQEESYDSFTADVEEHMLQFITSSSITTGEEGS